MAVRTSEAAVEAIIETDATISLTPFIEVANALVTECCADVDDYDATRLELIERWLSAHMYTVRDMRAESEKAGSVAEKKQSKVDIGFDTSHYGQTAMRVDTAGGLAALNIRIKKGIASTVQVNWMGTENPDLVEED